MQEREQHANGIPILAGSQVEWRGRSTVTQEQNRPPKAAGIRKDILALDYNIIIMDNVNGGKRTKRSRLCTRETRRHELKTQTRKVGKGIPALSYLVDSGGGRITVFYTGGGDATHGGYHKFRGVV